MTKIYQIQDFDVIDYDVWQLEGAPDLIRGPSTRTVYSDDPSYICYLGAAQTFGTLCRYPYPNLLSSILGVEALNLGLGGAGPKKFLINPKLIEYANRAKCVVVQVMAARSSENSLMVNPNGGSKFRWRTEPDSPLEHSEVFYKELLQKDKEIIPRLIAESREKYIEECRILASAINVPKILLWMSRREPDYEVKLDNITTLYGGFPQLVDQKTFDAISGFFDQTVMSVTSAGMPAPLLNRFTGRRTSIGRDRHVMKVNNYYPSQEQHMDAAIRLAPVLRDYA